jgi:8-amino-3,8-dideoxy-alpha-D-manno-octulosonate transaminase
MRKENVELPKIFFGSDIIDNAEINATIDVLKAKSLFRYYGAELLHKADQFESNLSDYFKIKHTLCVSSGTAALKCAIKSLNIKIGDEIIIPSYGFIATANAIIACNAIPILADIDASMNINPESIRRLISYKTKAIICVHISGQACNMNELCNISKEFSIPIIEDVAQSFGGSYYGKKLGTIGDIGCFSFQAHKILSTGEGGCIITNNFPFYKTAKIYHDQGGVRENNGFPTWDDESCIFGENLRMSELSASIGIEQLKKVNSSLAKVRYYKEKMLEVLLSFNVQLRDIIDKDGDCGVSVCFFVENIQNKKYILENLKSINAHSYYNSTVYENILFSQIKEKFSLIRDGVLDITKDTMNIGRCINAEKFARQAVWIPLSPLYNDENIDTICYILSKVLKDAGLKEGTRK